MNWTVKARQELVMVPAFTFQPLVENAIIHGIAPKEEGGSIRIVVRQKENRLRIAIRDDGIGMTEEELQQLKKIVLRRRMPGTEELALAMCTGGSLRCIRTGILRYAVKDAGTVIVIDIPCRGKRGYDMKRVLIADDEPIERMIVSRTVEKYFSEELTVVSAANGRGGGGTVFAGDCQIALLDIEMPGMNGLEAAEQIRKRDKNCSIIFSYGI